MGRNCLKLSEPHAGSLRSSGSEFQTVGPAIRNARWPYVLSRQRGTMSWCQFAVQKWRQRLWWDGWRGTEVPDHEDSIRGWPKNGFYFLAINKNNQKINFIFPLNNKRKRKRRTIFGWKRKQKIYISQWSIKNIWPGECESICFSLDCDVDRTRPRPPTLVPNADCG